MEYTKENIDKVANVFGYSDCTERGNGLTVFKGNDGYLKVGEYTTNNYGHNISSITEDRRYDGFTSILNISFDWGIDRIDTISFSRNRIQGLTMGESESILIKNLCPDITVVDNYFDENATCEDTYSYDENDRVSYKHFIDQCFNCESNPRVVGVNINTQGKVDVLGVKQTILSNLKTVTPHELLQLLDKLRAALIMINECEKVEDKLTFISGSSYLYDKILDELEPRIKVAEALNPAYNVQMLLKKK